MTRFPQPVPPPGPPRPAVFLDRDDTLIENATLPPEAFPATPGDLYLPEWVRPLPGTIDACRALADAGFVLIVITNQGCVARGNASLDQVRATNQRMAEMFTSTSGDPLFQGIYAAPHHPEASIPEWRADHPWRKPNPGMILAACEEHALDPSRSWLVGDADRDREAGIAAGLHPARCLRIGADAPCEALPDAVSEILAHKDIGAQADTPIRAVDATTVTLRAPFGDPLADPAVRATVESVARAIAERTGIALLALSTDERSITATLATHRLAATAFMAELRRATNAWHQGRGHPNPLWPRTPDAELDG